MSKAFGVNVMGIDKLRTKFANAPEKVENELKNIVNDTLAAIEAKAKNRVAVGKTGKLKASIKMSKFTMPNGGYVSAGNKNVIYAPFVEFGTGNKFGLRNYSNLNYKTLLDYAYTFKRIPPKKNVNLPYRPFLFSSASEEIGLMIERLKKITI